MKKPILIALGMAFFGMQVVAIAAPNFSGPWVRDASKSDPAPSPLWLTRATTGGRGGGGRGGGPGGRGNAAPVPMTVQQDANSLQVTEPQGGIRKYALDGKPHNSMIETGVAKAVVTASLQGDTIVIGTTRPYGGMPGNVELKVKEVWSLSPDGKTLTITTTDTSPAVEKISKQVYNRQ